MDAEQVRREICDDILTIRLGTWTLRCRLYGLMVGQWMLGKGGCTVEFSCSIQSTQGGRSREKHYGITVGTKLVHQTFAFAIRPASKRT